MIPQCSRYNVLGEDNRRSTYSGYKYYYCDSSDDSDISPNWKGAGWYRFQHPAGNKLAQSPPAKYNCGTYSTGWSNSTLPDKPGDSVDIKICFDYSIDNGNADDCWRSNEGKVTNCGSYYVYYLENKFSLCFRYCGNN